MRRLVLLSMAVVVALASCRKEDVFPDEEKVTEDFAVNLSFTKQIEIEKESMGGGRNLTADDIIGLMIMDSDQNVVFGRVFDGEHLPKSVSLKHGHKYLIMATACPRDDIEIEDGMVGGCFTVLGEKEILKSKLNGDKDRKLISLSATPDGEYDGISFGNRWYFQYMDGDDVQYTADVNNKTLNIDLLLVSFKMEVAVSNMPDNYDVILTDLIHGEDENNLEFSTIRERCVKLEPNEDRTVFSECIVPNNIGYEYSQIVKAKNSGVNTFKYYQMNIWITDNIFTDNGKRYKTKISEDFTYATTYKMSINADMEYDSGFGMSMEEWGDSVKTETVEEKL